MAVNDILSEINRWRNNNKISVFVGAGVSRLSGYPSWSGLVRLMSDEIHYTITGENEEKVFTSEELLKIPQMYFIQNGEEKYREKVVESFGGEYFTNSIHDLIFALQPKHILTTNYDNLLEKEAVKLGKNYSVINSDKVVSKAEASSFIVKLHGDFESEFVLKEQDYLDYDNNYMMIDKLVKSIFATNLVIFIGYGLNDYNIKLILNWVKNVQRDSFIKPIFIYTDQPLSELELKYQESRGLRVLQCGDFGEVPKEYEDRYTVILQNILKYDDKEKLLSSEDKTDFIANCVRGLTNMNYLRSKEINSIFKGEYCIDNNLQLSNISTIKKIEGFSQIHEMDYFEALIKTISQGNNANTEVIRFLSTAELKTTGNRFEKSSVEQIKSDAYGSKIKNMEIYCNKDSDDDNAFFRKAYYLGILGRYEESYKLFTELVAKLQTEEKWDLFYFAQINRKYLELLVNSISQYGKGMGGYFYFGQAVRIFSDNFINKLNIEMKAFSLKDQFSQLPMEFQRYYSSLAVFSNNNPFYDVNSKFLKEMNKAVKDRVRGTVYFAGMPQAETIKRKLYEEVKFVYENGLLISLFDEFKDYAKNALIVWLESYSHNLKDRSSLEEDFSNNILYSFTLNDIILMTESFSNDDLLYLSKVVDLKTIPFSEEAELIDYIEKQFDDYTSIFLGDKTLCGDRIVLYIQQTKRIRLLAGLATYFLHDFTFVKTFLIGIRKLWVRDFPLREIKTVIVRCVNVSKIDRQIAVDIIEAWFVDYIQNSLDEISIVNNERSCKENISEFVDILKQVGKDEVILKTVTIDLVTRLNPKYLKLFAPLYRSLNKDMQEYLMKNVPIDSIIDLQKRFGKNIPGDYDIIPIIHKTFQTVKEREQKENASFHATYAYSSKNLIKSAILAMLCKNIQIDGYAGISDEYDFWFAFKDFEPERFDIEWLQYYSNDILELIKSDEEKRKLVLSTLDKDAEKRNLEGYELRRYYYVYRYLTK